LKARGLDLARLPFSHQQQAGVPKYRKEPAKGGDKNRKTKLPIRPTNRQQLVLNMRKSSGRLPFGFVFETENEVAAAREKILLSRIQNVFLLAKKGFQTKSKS